MFAKPKIEFLSDNRKMLEIYLIEYLYIYIQYKMLEIYLIEYIFHQSNNVTILCVSVNF